MLRQAQIRTWKGMYVVWKKAFQVSPSPINYFHAGKKKCSGFEKVKRKIDTLLEIVIYAGFRFNQGKYSKTDLEKHSKLTSHYT